MSEPGGPSGSGDQTHRSSVKTKKGYPSPPEQEYLTAGIPPEDLPPSGSPPPRPPATDDLEEIYGGKARRRSHHHHDHMAAGAGTGEDDNLGSMYITREQVPQLSTDDFTIEEGAPKAPPADISGLIRVFVMLLLLVTVAASATMIRMPMVDADGFDVRLPLYEYLIAQVTMSAEQREIQSVEPADRPYRITRLRIREVYDAVQRHELHEGSMPEDVSDLVTMGYLRPEQSLDGWGGRFQIEGRGRTMLVRSNGFDGIPMTDNDVVMSDNGLALPSSWADRVY